MPPFSDLERTIGYRFRNAELLERSLTHRSYANENRIPYHNERMEFLGDAVLNLVVSEHLMKTCPESTEGDLSRFRAAVVSEPALASIARSLGLGRFILLGRGEEQTGGRNKDSLLANCLEALIAAIYGDVGKDAAEAFINRFFDETIRKTCTSGSTFDYKTRLQELCQERLKQLPDYRIVSESGPDHQKEFAVEVRIRGRVSGHGIGRSKKEAEQRAAKEALEQLTEQKP
jgi:ribonuclease-3